MAYALTLKNYEGPLEKLLELIEERELQINDVSLAAVTDDFLRYLEKMKAEIAEGVLTKEKAEEELRMLADFIVVASRLILIKSKSLLPDLALTQEEESDIQDLEMRLALYQKLKATQKHVADAWGGDAMSAARAYFTQLSDVPAIFEPGNNVNQAELVAALSRVYEGLQKFVLETETIRETILSLEEKMKDIVSRMQSMTETTLRTLGGGSRAETVVAFLAILHLAREQLVFLTQDERFSDIIVRKNDG